MNLQYIIRAYVDTKWGWTWDKGGREGVLQNISWKHITLIATFTDYNPTFLCFCVF